jgi:arylsulfatase A-like enzyme
MSKLHLSLILIFTLATAFAPGIAEAATPGDKPNVLFIAVDDLNDWIGVLGGNPQSKTPNIDRLAKRGVLFTNAHCAAPACNPSRAALMTGLRPHHTGVYTNPQPWRPVMPHAVTLSQHFMQHGYTAMGCGKIYHGRYKDPSSWDEYNQGYGDPKPSAAVLKDPHSSAGGIKFGRLDAKDEDMNDYKQVSWAIDKLKAKHDKPLFLACGIYRPHMPWQVPSKYYDMYPLDEIVLPIVPEDDLDDIPAAGLKMANPGGDHKKVVGTKNWPYAVQAYLASIAFADAQIGRLIDALDASDKKDNTIIVFWTDHGWHLGEKEHWRKFALWEEATRTPMVIVAPGVTEPNQRCDRPVNLIDIYPTLMELCGLDKREELVGTSFGPLLANPSMKWDRPSLTTHGRLNHALRSDRWRYIRYADGSEELYDHQSDPMEHTNVADRPENKAVIKKLAKWLPTTNVPDAPKDQGLQKSKKQ